MYACWYMYITIRCAMDKFPAKEFKNYPEQEEYKKGKWNHRRWYDNQLSKYTPMTHFWNATRRGNIEIYKISLRAERNASKAIEQTAERKEKK